MNVETLERREVREEPRSVATPAAPVLPLAAVVAAVRRDAATEPLRYLDEVVVPYGGE
jgi:hypothetical protein